MGNALMAIDGLLLVIVGMWNYGAHWTPWQMIPFLVNERGELHRVVAYTHGTMTILVTCMAWALARWWLGVPVVAAWSAVLFLTLAIVAAGMGTVLPRGFRWIVEKQAQEGDVHDYEQALQG